MDNRLKELSASTRRVLNLGVYLQYASLATSLCLIATATAWTATKVFAPTQHLDVLWTLAAWPPALLAALLWCYRRDLFYTEQQALVLADHLRLNNAELPARHENPGLYATPADHAIPMRRPRLSLMPSLKKITPAVCYLALVALVPASQPQPERVNLALQVEIDDLNDFLQDDLLKEDRREELKENIERIEAREDGLTREKWEAVTEMQEQVADAHRQAINEIEGIEAVVSNMAEALDAGKLVQNRAMLTEAGMQLTSALENLQAFGNKEAIEALKQMAGQCKLGGKGKAKLNPSDLGKKLNDLKKKLGKCKGQCKAGGRCNMPGQGGINRGRGDANMTYNENPTERSNELDLDLINNQMEDQYHELGVSYVAPEGPVEQGASSAVIDVAGASGPGGQVQRVRVSPSQRDVLQRYFKHEIE